MKEIIIVVAVTIAIVIMQRLFSRQNHLLSVSDTFIYPVAMRIYMVFFQIFCIVMLVWNLYSDTQDEDYYSSVVIWGAFAMMALYAISIVFRRWEIKQDGIRCVLFGKLLSDIPKESIDHCKVHNLLGVISIYDQNDKNLISFPREIANYESFKRSMLNYFGISY